MTQNCHFVCSCYLLTKIYPLIITVQRLTEFLLFHLVDKGYTPSTIRGYRSAIARTIHLSSCSALAMMDYLSLMVKHLCNERPKQMMFSTCLGFGNCSKTFSAFTFSAFRYYFFKVAVFYQIWLHTAEEVNFVLLYPCVVRQVLIYPFD